MIKIMVAVCVVCLLVPIAGHMTGVNPWQVGVTWCWWALMIQYTYVQYDCYVQYYITIYSHWNTLKFNMGYTLVQQLTGHPQCVMCTGYTTVQKATGYIPLPLVESYNMITIGATKVCSTDKNLGRSHYNSDWLHTHPDAQSASTHAHVRTRPYVHSI